MLPADILQQQVRGGTWRDMFDANGLAASFPVPVWVLALLAAGLIGFPYAWLAARSLPDRGYALSRPVGLLLVTWLVVVALEPAGACRSRVGDRGRRRDRGRRGRRDRRAPAGRARLLGSRTVAPAPASRRPSSGPSSALRSRPLVEPRPLARRPRRREADGLRLPERRREVRALPAVRPVVRGRSDELLLLRLRPDRGAGEADGHPAGGRVQPRDPDARRRSSARPSSARHWALPSLTSVRRRTAVAVALLATLFVTVLGNLGELRVLRSALDRSVPIEWWFWNPTRVIAPGPGRARADHGVPGVHLHLRRSARARDGAAARRARRRARGRRRARAGRSRVAVDAPGPARPRAGLAVGHEHVGLPDVPAARVLRRSRCAALATAALVAGPRVARRRGAVRDRRLPTRAFLPFHLRYDGVFEGVARWRGSRTGLSDYLIDPRALPLHDRVRAPRPARVRRGTSDRRPVVPPPAFACWDRVRRRRQLCAAIVRPTALQRIGSGRGAVRPRRRRGARAARALARGQRHRRRPARRPRVALGSRSRRSTARSGGDAARARARPHRAGADGGRRVLRRAEHRHRAR